MKTARKRKQTMPAHLVLVKAVITEAQRNAVGKGSPAPSAAERREAGEFIKYLKGED